VPDVPKATVHAGDAGGRRGIHDAHALRDAVTAWAFVAVLVTFLVRINVTLPLVGHVGSALVAVLFLYVPCAILVIFPIFSLGYFMFYEVACNSKWLAHLVPHGMCSRYGGLSGLHAPAMTWKLAEFCAVQLVVVALPEELFFRGFLLGLLEKRFPPKRRILGGGVGLALVISAAAFALIHLPKDGDPRALATFVPGLLFGWMRSATRSILGSTLTHAGSNILIRFLDLSTLR